MNMSRWNTCKNGYQLVFRRRSGTDPGFFTSNWAKWKLPFGDTNNFFMGLENLHS